MKGRYGIWAMKKKHDWRPDNVENVLDHIFFVPQYFECSWRLDGIQNSCVGGNPSQTSSVSSKNCALL